MECLGFLDSSGPLQRGRTGLEAPASSMHPQASPTSVRARDFDATPSREAAGRVTVGGWLAGRAECQGEIVGVAGRVGGQVAAGHVDLPETWV
jgi:hypothetical protein